MFIGVLSRVGGDSEGDNVEPELVVEDERTDGSRALENDASDLRWISQ